MGQKKRSSAPRSAISSVSSSNGSLLHPSPSAESVSFRNIRSLIPVDAELSPNAPGNGVNAEVNVSTNGGEHDSNGGPGISKGLEVSKTCQEDPSNLKGDCEKALVALRRGNSNKALRLIRDACARYEGNALAQRIRGHICMRLASMIEDVTTKQRHLKDAIDAAQKAVLLSPRSVEYAQFHAQLLFEAATDSKGYEEVVQECQRALEIEDPVDPAKESLHEEVQHTSTTAEARIQVVQQELRNLVQKANIASISNWMKTLGTGGNEEKLRFIHMRKLVDDPMEQRISQPKRPHEVKKCVKTTEEKRKDIEVRVAAARLLQQKRDCSPPHSDDGSSKTVRGSGRLQRRKSGGANSRKQNQAQSIEEKIERLKPFWNSLSSEERERMLEIPLDAFKQQFISLKPNVTSELLIEALEFAQGRKTWRFWMCWNCGERCTEYQEHAEHITDKHIEGLPTKLRRLFPREVGHDMADQILTEDCRPFDAPLAIKLLIGSHVAEIDLEDAQRQQEPSVIAAGFDCINDKVTTSIDCSFYSAGDPINSNLDIDDITSDNTDGKIEEHVLNTDKPIMSDVKHENPNIITRISVDMKGHDFPYADDDERMKLLQKIYNLLRILLRSKCLAADHMEKIMQYAHDELKNFIPTSSVHYEFSNNLAYVRFLPALQLRRVLSYLRELANACGIDQQLDTGLPQSTQNEEEDVILDRLFLNEDLTILSLDERLLKETPVKCKEVGFTAGSGNSLKQHIHDSEMEPRLPLMMMKDGSMASHADMQLSWIYGTADYEYQPGAWKQYRETRAQQGREIFKEIEKEYLALQSFCEKKHEQIHAEAAVNMAEALCIEELKKRELKVDGSLSCHDAVLRKRKQDLLECRETGLSTQQKLELEVITSMLRDARTVNLRQFSYDNSITLTSTHLSDSDEEVEDAWRVPDFVPQSDSHIELAIQWKKDRCTSEVNKLDAKILRSMDTIQKLEHKLGSLSVLDYRSVLLPLVKTFLKAQLEEAAEKDAMRKSEAAREAFLAELSHNGKGTIEKLSDSARSVKEKSKDKKKNKEQRRSKDGKQGSAAVVETQQNMTRLVVDSENADEEDALEWELDESQKLIEAELKRQAEVEDEERKLAETLELQRRIEEETKEKHLAELRKKNAEVEPKLPFRIQGDAEDLHNSPGQLEFEGIVSTSIKEIELVESLPSSSVLMNAEIPKEVSSTADASISVDRDNPMAVSSHDHIVLPHSESQESGSSRQKKSGKNRRRRLSRASHEDNHISTNGEQSSITGQCVEQIRTVTDFDISECNGMVEGVKPHETGRNITTNSSSLWDRTQSGDKDGENTERIDYPSERTLRELKAEQDAEERFQADLEQAMRQSLVNAAEYPPLISEIDTPTSNDIIIPQNKRISEEVGKGLQNEIGQYNCFLNVVIQSLWHLQRFREELLDDSSTHHVHMGDPCVLCALRDIFVGLKSPSSYSTKEIVAPTTLRIALSNLSPQKEFFQEAQMNDASEVLAVVFDCIHKAFSTNSVLSDEESDTGSGVGFWECHDNAPCIAHSLFALDIARQMNCTKCGLESRHLKYTTFFHNINANSLRTAKILYQENSLDQLLRLVEMNEFLACDVEMGGCGQQNYIHYLLRAAPHVFITVLGWQNSRESFEDISATMDVIAADLDVGIVYCGLDSGYRHRLVSVICYYGQHYHCFSFNHEIGRWVMFDDTTVKVIGSYEDVMDTCRRGHLQPQVLFYEASKR